MNWDLRIHRGTFLASLGYMNERIPFDADRVIHNHPIPRRDYNHGMEITTMMMATVIIRPLVRTGRKSSKHRVFIVCPNCAREIPSGRLHQHVCKGGS